MIDVPDASVTAAGLPPGVQVIERGWLSSNSVVFLGAGDTALVDTGYCTRAAQTVALVDRVLAGRPLDLLVNTHLHSDHCGGNAALQRHHPGVRTLIPPGPAEAVRRWDTTALGYVPTGQDCPRFGFDGLLQPGGWIELGDRPWQVHAAPGHDPDAVLLFEPDTRTLISADALWENGFGIVFPELEGGHAFELVGATLDLIEGLQPRTVIPGHGPPFIHTPLVVERARSRLAAFIARPERHAAHAAKVMLKFKLLDVRSTPFAALVHWAAGTLHFQRIHARFDGSVALDAWIAELLQQLVQSGAARRADDLVLDA